MDYSILLVALIWLLVAYAIYRYIILEKLVVARTKDMLEANQRLKNEHSMMESMLNDKSFLVEIASTLNSTSSTYEEIGKILGLLNRKMRISHVIIMERDIITDNFLSSVYLITQQGVQNITNNCDKFPMSILEILKKEDFLLCPESDKLEYGAENCFFSFGMRSICIFPALRLNSGLVGLFGFGRGERNDWCKDEVEMLKAITSMLLNAWWSYREFHGRLAAEKKRTEAVKLAEKSVRMASIGVIAAGITHEISQPLNDIKIAADSVVIWNENNSRLLPDNFRRWLESISGNVNRISEIIEQMRTYWSSPTELSFSPLELNASIRHAITLVDHQLKAHNITLKIEESDTSLVIEGNKVNLEQVILNLVVNAIHALDTVDKLEKIIEIKINRLKSQAVIEVIDNGPGFPGINVQKLFDPFYSTKKPQLGMGLGLAIVKRFVEGFGGSVSARNIESGGAYFTVTIPLSSENRQGEEL